MLSFCIVALNLFATQVQIKHAQVPVVFQESQVRKFLTAKLKERESLGRLHMIIMKEILCKEMKRKANFI